jgi:hypothetical protein
VIARDEYGLAARFPGGVIPPGTLVRRNPGDRPCAACLESPDGFCGEHPEFYSEPLPLAEDDGEGVLRAEYPFPDRSWGVA